MKTCTILILGCLMLATSLLLGMDVASEPIGCAAWMENALGDVRPLMGTDQDGLATFEIIVFLCMSKGSNKTRHLENALAESPGHFEFAARPYWLDAQSGHGH